MVQAFVVSRRGDECIDQKSNDDADECLQYAVGCTQHQIVIRADHNDDQCHDRQPDHVFELEGIQDGDQQHDRNAE
ncbi:hypothetical protein SDC9_93511 [bioreactor metagenome]|uniref:Uncharacterized protein n=1 Tax=bioreactor metagenome TaxID=1076179 RepID=A0A645AAT7_9ZZZZ